MPNEPTINDFGECIDEVIVLAVNLVDYELDNVLDQLETAIASPNIKAAINSSLLQYAQTKVATKSSITTVEEFKKLGTEISQKITNQTKENLKKQIEQTEEYKAFQQSLKNVKHSFQHNTKLGVFIDKNKKMLYIICGAVVIGGVGVLYHVPKGKKLILDGIELLKDNPVVLPIGDLKLKATLFEFNPDARTYAGAIGVETKLEGLEIKANVGMLVETTKVQQIKGDVVLKYPAFSMQGTIDYKPVINDIHLTLKMSYDKNRIKLSIGTEVHNKELKGFIDGQYQLNKQVNLGFSGNVYGNTNSKIMWDILFKATIRFHK